MIKKKRIRRLNPYKNLLPSTDGAYVAFMDATEAQLRRAGFDKDAVDGTTLLPSIVGKVTRYNAEGKWMKQMKAPLETVYHTTMRYWKDWHGNDHSGLVDMPYKRRPRRFIAPPSIELTLSKNTEGKVTIVSGLVGDWRNDEEPLIHAINLFLELFGECVILDEEKSEVLPTNIQRVNWKILPEGEYPFERVKQELRPVLNRINKSKRSFVDERLERLNGFKPEYTVIGQNGFSGYIVMAYPDRNLYILESLLYGNATYALSEDWQSVSQLSKAEILNNRLHKGRVIHRTNWFAKVKDLFGEYPTTS